jgi:hypothetical protein
MALNMLLPDGKMTLDDEGNSTHKLTFTAGTPADQSQYRWYQLMYREYLTPERALLKVDIMTRSNFTYFSGREEFNPKGFNAISGIGDGGVCLPAPGWVLDANFGDARFNESYRHDDDIAGCVLKDTPTWSTNVGWWSGSTMVRSSLKDIVGADWKGVARMYFCAVLVKGAQAAVRGVAGDYDVVKSVVFLRTWDQAEKTSNLTTFILAQVSVELLKTAIGNWSARKQTSLAAVRNSPATTLVKA